jgi:hypothetical protein
VTTDVQHKSKHHKFFLDKDGHLVLWQFPNTPLVGWGIFKLLSMIVSRGHVQTGFAMLSSAFLFTWAFLEITKGANHFRRLLGLLAFVIVVVGYFK